VLGHSAEADVLVQMPEVRLEVLDAPLECVDAEVRVMKVRVVGHGAIVQRVVAANADAQSVTDVSLAGLTRPECRDEHGLDPRPPV